MVQVIGTVILHDLISYLSTIKGDHSEYLASTDLTPRVGDIIYSVDDEVENNIKDK